MAEPAQDLRADIDAFVAELLEGYDCKVPPADKVIHDPVWGTNSFRPHEVAILDSPVLQRLRRIYQTGFSLFTFPSTTQSRFEHSLGASVVSTRILEAIARRHPDRVNLDPKRGDLAQIRAAALLHDCGHGFASHVSEALYKWHPAIAQARASEDKFADVDKASELLSWHIVTSPAFRRFLATVNNQCGTTLDPDTIADLILGLPYQEQNFLAEVINGPFDADRLDYIVRDSDYSGIKSAVDLERLFFDIDIALLPDGRLHLVLRSTHAIEQLLWTKVHLFSRLYRHHKVAAADGVAQSLVPIVKATGFRFRGVDFSRVSDYLRVTDADILGAEITAAFPSELAAALRKLRSRRLPQRCLAITPAAIKPSGTTSALQKLQRVNEVDGELDQIRQAIWEAIPEVKRPFPHSIILSFPPTPPLREASLVYILLRGRTEPQTLDSIFRIDEWLTTYTESHWAGHIFSHAHVIDVVTDAAFDVLTARGIELDRLLATSMRKPPIAAAAPAPLKATAQTEPLLEPAPGLPVLETFVQERLAGSSPAPFRDLHAVLILHFLTDLPPMLERLQRLGLDPNKTWLVRKNYKYQFAQSIREKLRAQGYNVEECTAAEGPEEPARRVLRNLQKTLSEKDRFFVIEDGGYVTPLLHGSDFAELRQHCLGVVEQTTKGLRSIQSVDPLRIPVVGVARSKLKTILEAAEVGEALAFTLETYFRRFRSMPLRVPTLVIGFGAVGKNLADALVSRGAHVTIYDRDFERQAEALSHKPAGFPLLADLSNLTAFDLIVGTTGTTSLEVGPLLRTKHNVVLASGSSDRLEFDLAGLVARLPAPTDQNIVMDGLVTQYRLADNHFINVLCDGYPVNFILGDGIAKRIIDPILTELVAGATLIADGEFSEPGVHNLPSSLEEELFQIFRKLTPH